MRVLVHCADRGVPLYGPSGASEHLRGVIRALSRAGHDVRVSVRCLVDARGRWGRSLDVPAFEGPPSGWPRGLRTLGEGLDAAVPLHRSVADGWSPDWIWERHALASGVTGFAMRIGARWLVELNAPVVIERRATGARVSRRVASRQGLRLRLADRVVAVSGWLANHAVAHGACPHRVRVVPNGVEPPASAERVAARRSLPVPDDAKLVLGFVGTFKPAHGVARLPALVDALGPETWLVTVGDGPARLPAHPRIRSLGQRAPEVLGSLVAGFDVGLAPYDADAPPWFCPLKLLEYRAHGVPTVCGPIPAASRLLGDAGGEVVSHDTVEAWRDAVRRQAGRRPTPWVRSWDDVVAEALA
ncbi:MAG: glycosyltransferase family 4 protein [Myxococcota bacterium]